MNRGRKKRALLAGYVVLAVSGLFIGVAAGPGGGPGRDDSVEDLIERALQRIAEDDETGRDAGVAGERVEGSVPYAPSPEPGTADGGVGAKSPWRDLPEPDAKGGAGEKVLVVEITEDIELGMPAYIKRAIEDNPDAAALIVELDTPGGRVDAATEIRDLIMNVPEGMRTVAFIHPRAISAGAFITYSCDLIFISKGGTIGAATPISISGGEAEPVEEKFVSYFRAEMASTARAKGRRGDIAEAMVDADVEIEGIIPAGKLLTLDTAGALRVELADGRADSMDEVLEKLALGGADVVRTKLNWAERAAQIITSPVVAGILMSLGLLGILIELYQPGFGAPGIVGLCCLAVFFGGHLVVHLAGWGEVIFFVIGVVLLAIEIYVTPGFGVVGVIGAALILGSLVMALISAPIDVAFDTGALTRSALQVLLSMLAVIVLFIAALSFLPKTKLKNRLVLDTAVDGTVAGGPEGEAVSQVVHPGVTGIADTYLRPSGIARIEGRRIDVVTEGDFVARGEGIVVVRTEGNRVIVKKGEQS